MEKEEIKISEIITGTIIVIAIAVWLILSPNENEELLSIVGMKESTYNSLSSADKRATLRVARDLKELKERGK